MYYTIEAIFWICIFIVFYTYVGYALVLLIIAQFIQPRVPKVTPQADLPEVTLVIAAYNEADFIAEKLKNSLHLDYPAGKLSVLVVTDGSNDATPDIARTFQGVTVHHSPERKGKIHAVNRIMPLVSTPIVVYCDANTLLNQEAIRLLVSHYTDPQVGGVAGEKKIFMGSEESASGAGEGLYWKYESFLKQTDARVYSVVGAAGELFSLRTELYEAPPPDMIIEDFYLSLRVCAKGYRFAYEPNAFAQEYASANVEEEWKRKVRISAGGFQAMYRLAYLLNPFRYGILTFQYFSHRVMRWTLAPLGLAIALLTNILLAFTIGKVYILLLAGQSAFYGLALLGKINRNKPIRIKGFFVPYYFVVMNAAVFAGFFRYLKGNQSVVWEKAIRAGV